MSTSGKPTRVECRAFLAETPELPCCNGSNDKTLCQPDTGISRLILDIVNASDPISSAWCKVGVDLNSIPAQALNDMCPAGGQPQYCREKNEFSGSVESDIPTYPTSSSSLRIASPSDTSFFEAFPTTTVGIRENGNLFLRLLLCNGACSVFFTVIE